MQPEAQPGRVWIIGAGFSRPLGGPLLSDLLSAKSKAQVVRRYGEPGKHLVESPCARIVHWLFDRANNTPRPATEKPQIRRDVEYWNEHNQVPPFDMQRQWADAEEFLVWLDDAANANGIETREFHDALFGAADQLHEVDTSPPQPPRPMRPMSPYAAAARISPWGHDDDDEEDDDEPRVTEPASKHAWWCKFEAKRVWQVAKLLLAAETSVFVEDDTLGTNERWKPYLSWVAKLSANDTVISFNYDCAIEAIVSHYHASGVPKVLGVPASEGWLRSCKDKPTLLKLHGSACWQSAGDATQETASYSDVLTRFEQGTIPDILIAAPGSSKVSLADRQLSFLWVAAMEAIRQATTVNVIGYRFPESDNLPKERLLEALGEAPSLSRINLILGRNSVDTQPVSALLRASVDSHVQVSAEPLGSSDFLCTPKAWGTSAVR